MPTDLPRVFALSGLFLPPQLTEQEPGVRRLCPKTDIDSLPLPLHDSYQRKKIKGFSRTPRMIIGQLSGLLMALPSISQSIERFLVGSRELVD